MCSYEIRKRLIIQDDLVGNSSCTKTGLPETVFLLFAAEIAPARELI
jgi:hypothetical protein